MSSSNSSPDKMSLLEFEIELFQSSLEQDNLTVMSSGLGMNRHLMQLMQHFIENENFVVFTGTGTEEERILLQMFQHFSKLPDRKLPKVINADNSIAERKKIYSENKILFITGRILVVDLLTNRIPINEINGLIICNAHRNDDSCQNAFICRLLRMQNRNAFIKAFSGNPCAFTNGPNKIEQVMRQLFLKRLSLWPRCHSLVNESFENRTKPELIEIRLPFTEYMNQVHRSLMILINMLLKEVGKSNLAFLSDVEDLNAENVITQDLNEYYAIHFYPVWHQLNVRTKRNLQDIKILKNLLFSLTSDDCVSFYKLVRSIRQSMKLDTRLSDWVLWNPAESLFIASKQRLYNIRKVHSSHEPAQEDEQALFASDEEEEEEEQQQQQQQQQHEDTITLDSQSTQNDPTTPPEHLQLEKNMKWKTFCEILEEIKSGVQGPVDQTDINIMVLVENDRTIQKLQQVIDRGPEVTLEEIYYRGQLTLEKMLETIVDDEKEEGGEDALIESQDTSICTQVISRFDQTNNQERKVLVNIHFHCTKEGQTSWENKLFAIRPWWIICYDYNVPCIRTLEMYQAIVCSPERCRVYLLLYDNSAEEQRYFTSLKKEKLSFERLISFRSTMLAPTDREGTNEVNADLIRGRPDNEILVNKAIWEANHNNEQGYLCDLCSQYFDISEEHSRPNKRTQANEDEEQEEQEMDQLLTSSSKPDVGVKCCIACKQITRKQIIRQKVIVDMREFRCTLPSIIHKRGIDLIPATIDIGDYILTPDICVERKSISDLTQSLQSGRLFAQCKMMTRHYRKCIILIEFDENKSFNMKGKYWRTERNEEAALSEYDLVSKLILLTIHFPQIKLIWSPSPQFSGELFDDLKVGREQPDLKQALKITEQELAPEMREDRYDIHIKDFLLHLPGVNVDNVHGLMNSVDSIHDLNKRSRADLIKILASEQNANQLFQALHQKVVSFCLNDEIKAKQKPKRIFTKINGRRR